MFSVKQLKQLSDRGISLEQVSRQVKMFKKGIEPVKLLKPAVPADGIEVFDQKEIDYFIGLFRDKKNDIPLIKFVPASGAASRMFKTLFEALNEFKNFLHDSDTVFRKMPEMITFFKDLKAYAFYDDLLKACSSRGKDPESLIGSESYAELLSLILADQGLAYGELPKGLLKFHAYSNETRTAFEEHFIEAAEYLKDKHGMVKLHFTVSPEHQKMFQTLSDKLIKKYIQKNRVHFKVEFSVQKPSTDTLAVDMDNNPFIHNNGILLFRPGGHGALLENMQDIEEKMIFIGNIDNVAPDRIKTLRVRYKELLGGVLSERVDRVHKFLFSLEKGLTRNLHDEIISFVDKYISSASAQALSKLTGEAFRELALSTIDRPIRVCGMVKNAGEPGGGPFWIIDKHGKVSKQVVESSQVNLNDPQQDKIFKEATHFNPVDLVCYTSNYLGEKFELEKFRDPDMDFIAIKSQGGSSLKALELPGLWNGSMAGWLTFFVDVPIETFSPVKTIFDLRREEHIE